MTSRLVQTLYETIKYVFFISIGILAIFSPMLYSKGANASIFLAIILYGGGAIAVITAPLFLIFHMMKHEEKLLNQKFKPGFFLGSLVFICMGLLFAYMAYDFSLPVYRVDHFNYLLFILIFCVLSLPLFYLGIIMFKKLINSKE